MKDIDLAGIYLQDVKYFIQAAESLNFSLVARENAVTPSAVSKSIARIENATDLILFVRYQGKLRLTSAGRVLKEQLAGFTRDFEVAVSDAHKSQEGLIDSFSIGIPNENVMPELVACIKELKKIYPHIDVSAGIYDFATLNNKLQDGSLDLIFTSYFERDTFKNTNIKWKTVKKMPLCVFIPESNQLYNKEKVSITDLKYEKFVVHSPSMVPGYIKLIKELCEQYGFVPMIDKYSANIGSFIMDLVFGNGVLIGDELIRSNFPDSIKCFPIEGTVSGNIVAWRNTEESRVMKDLINIIVRTNR